MTLTVHSTTSTVTPLTVSESVFGAAPNKTLIAQAVRVFLNNQRQGTAKVKTRAEVARTKKKWYKQKGTGGARHGARTPSIFVGGGVTHGPTGEQNWKLSLSKKMKQKALICALSAQAKNIIVVDDLMSLDGKTSSAVKLLAKIAPDKNRVLVILDRPEVNVLRSMSNLRSVVVTSTDNLTTYEVAGCDVCLMTSKAVDGLTKRLTPKEDAETKVISSGKKVSSSDSKLASVMKTKVVTEPSSKKAAISPAVKKATTSKPKAAKKAATTSPAAKKATTSKPKAAKKPTK